MFYGASSQFTVISTVVTAAKSANLTTLAAVKAELNLTSSDANRDAVLSRYISAGSLAIRNFCNRDFAAETIQDEFFPQKDPPVKVVIGGQDPLQLSRWPIVSVSSVVELGTPLVAGTDYLENDALGQLTRLDNNGYPQRWPIRPIVVQYQAGYANVPADVEDACINYVKFRYFARRRDPGVKEENVQGVYSAQYLWGTGPGGPDDLPAQVSGAVERYRVPVIA